MKSTPASDAIDKARRLFRKGESEAAILQLNILADADDIDAMIELAHIARHQDRKLESDRWIERAEAALKPGNLDGHVTLYGAYSLGLGGGRREVLDARALHHLEQVAMEGNIAAQESMALNFLHGLNGCEKNHERFEYWIRLSIDAGSIRAAYIYAEYLFKKGRPVEPFILDKLTAMRGQNKASDRLVNAIVGRQK